MSSLKVPEGSLLFGFVMLCITLGTPDLPYKGA